MQLCFNCWETSYVRGWGQIFRDAPIIQGNASILSFFSICAHYSREYIIQRNTVYIHLLYILLFVKPTKEKSLYCQLFISSNCQITNFLNCEIVISLTYQFVKSNGIFSEKLKNLNIFDSGVDSEATTPSSPEDDPHEHDGENSNSRSGPKSVVCPASTCKTRTGSIDESASAHRYVLIRFCPSKSLFQPLC